ncbi:hypothetical protein BLL42_23790 [Pseudomonas frederiksbergensis]|uniref:DUF4225 domain-containing protein n=1 Tax=Pseudomonas frederiksbergensis TaxID=104087 RepID=A0A1J0ERK7_9PSED|nr:DUF4225 domain-containing protein [Pseudomonas frederiksbergensis]APC18587.1 hypothetical protein BLL42_23790 [Pseudomonas frederiksbergensis]
MSDDTCDIHDVTKAASDLVAFGCSIGATQLYDSFLQLQFSSIVSSYANEIIQAVDEGLISAQRGIQEIREEYAELSSKALFYAQNGIGVLAGAMQVQSGASKIGNTRGLQAPLGLLYSAHGVNNIYESLGNIYNGPGTPAVVGPFRKLYQNLANDTHTGNITYYTVDLSLSAFGLLNSVRKTDSVELFNRDAINYERAYKQMGKLALAFEALIDAITINSIAEENNFRKNHITR